MTRLFLIGRAYPKGMSHADLGDSPRDWLVDLQYNLPMPEGQLQFWIATQEAGGAATVLGPFGQSAVAIEQREAIKRNGYSGQVSAVYAAADRQNAEENARFYLPVFRYETTWQMAPHIARQNRETQNCDG